MSKPLIKLTEVCSFIKKETLAKVSTFFTKQLQVTDSDIGMEVAVIYNLNLSLQFVSINVVFSSEFLCCRMLQCRLNFCIDLAGLFLATPCKTASKEKIITSIIFTVFAVGYWEKSL